MKNVLLSYLVYEYDKTFNVIFYFFYNNYYYYYFCGTENFITKKRNNNTVKAAFTKLRLAKLGGLNPRSKEPKNKK